jgi:diguanylate cyclase (GGDEF)-like protein
MTRLKNVRYFRARLYEEYAKALRSRQPLSVAIVDLDHFKRINDLYGHPVGDRVLMAAARAIASVVRKGETAARVGGEEFALLLPGSNAAEGRIVAERVRKAIQRAIVPKPEDTSDLISVSASVGLACTDATGYRGPEVLYGAADEALLRAKRDGRDRVSVNTRPSSAPPLRLLA